MQENKDLSKEDKMKEILVSMCRLPMNCLSVMGRLLLWTSAITAIAGYNILIPGSSGKEPSDRIKQDLTDDTLVLDGAPHRYGNGEPVGGRLNQASFKSMSEDEFLEHAIKINEAGVPIVRSQTNKDTIYISGETPIRNARPGEGLLITHTLIKNTIFNKDDKISGGKVVAAEYSQEANFPEGVMKTTCFFKPEGPDARKDCSIEASITGDAERAQNNPLKNEL